MAEISDNYAAPPAVFLDTCKKNTALLGGILFNTNLFEMYTLPIFSFVSYLTFRNCF